MSVQHIPSASKQKQQAVIKVQAIIAFDTRRSEMCARAATCRFTLLKHKTRTKSFHLAPPSSSDLEKLPLRSPSPSPPAP